MKQRPIPERAPIGDPFEGTVIAVPNGAQAVIDPAPAEAVVIAAGMLIARYGIRYLGKPHLSIVPGLIAVDYGTLLTGEEGWNFLIHRSNLYPRAEVFGYRHDGRDEMVFLKQLDLALNFDVLIYASSEATKPIARPSALIGTDEALARLPVRLREALPHFATYADWLHEQSDE